MKWYTEGMSCCECKLCRTEREWEDENGTCYRCEHGLPCQIALENGELCEEATR